MLIYVNRETVEVKDSAVLSDVLEGNPYRPGCVVAIIRPTESIKRETDEFEIQTPKGPMGLRLNDSKYAALLREIVKDIKGKKIRWQTSKVLAIGAFPTQIEVSHEPAKYEKFDCFFALGGFDSRTSYLMIAKLAHEGKYGSTGAVMGKITKGRHILQELQEGESILDIVPVIEEISEKDAFITADMKFKLAEGMSVETYIRVKLDRRSPVNCEHFLLVTEKGALPITERTETYSSCSVNMDVKLVAEDLAIREPGTVTVRHEGAGAGRIYIYKTRRQISPNHSRIGEVTNGLELLRLAPVGTKVTSVSDPPRIILIGMTQKEGQKVLEAFGLRQRRTGEEGDEAIIVEQEPELTLEAAYEPEIETLGVRPEKINEITIEDEKAPQSARYLRKMTGLNHKPIGTMKVHFTFPEMPLVTFEGDVLEAGTLIPENEFKEVAVRGDIAITNMSRPNRGLIGIRLEPSEEFGPTGEERYGTNTIGKVVSSLDALMKDMQEGDIIYVRELKEISVPSKKVSKRNKTIKGAKIKGEKENG